MFKTTKKNGWFLVGLILIFSFSFSWAQGKKFISVIDSITLEMKNGKVRSPNEDEKKRLKSMVNQLSEDPSLFISIWGAFSKAAWRGYSKDANDALNASIATYRASELFKTLLDGDLSDENLAFIDQRSDWNPVPDETTGGLPYGKILLYRDERFSQLSSGFAGVPSVADLVLRVKNDSPAIDPSGVEALEKMADQANRSKTPLGFIITSGNDKAVQAVHDQLKDHLQNPETPIFVIPYPGKEDSSEDSIVIVSLAQDAAGAKPLKIIQEVSPDSLASKKREEENQRVVVLGDSTRTSQKKMIPSSSLKPMVQVQLNGSSGWGNHDPEISSFQIFPTVGVGVQWKDFTSTCSFQLPGSFFQNEDGKLNVADVSFMYRVYGPLCVNLSYQQYLSQRVVYRPSHPEIALKYKEQPKGYGLGVYSKVYQMGVAEFGVGGNLLFEDRTYWVPSPVSSRWVIHENGKWAFKAQVNVRILP